MKAIDRIMRAYTSTRVLTEQQQQQVREELLKFIQELIVGKEPVAAKLRDDNNAPS